MQMWATNITTPAPGLSSLLFHLNPSLPPPPPALKRSCCSKWASPPPKKTVRAVGESSSPPTPFPQDDQPLYQQGVYGPWTIEPSDVREVILYRSGLVTAAASFVIASSTAFLPPDSVLSDFIKPNLDFLYALGASGLGLSLYFIHIYVSEIKRTLQALWILGALGSVVTYANFAQPAGKDLVGYVIQNPTAIWFIGPLFAALTGLVFKEGVRSFISLIGSCLFRSSMLKFFF